jgi:hypothetical protein
MTGKHRDQLFRFHKFLLGNIGLLNASSKCRVPRASPTACYLASYSDVKREKVEERVATSDKQIIDLSHSPRICERNRMYKIVFAFISHLHISQLRS